MFFFFSVWMTENDREMKIWLKYLNKYLSHSIQMNKWKDRSNAIIYDFNYLSLLKPTNRCKMIYVKI